MGHSFPALLLAKKTNASSLYFDCLPAIAADKALTSSPACGMLNPGG
jgi:hypothetical protein